MPLTFNKIERLCSKKSIDSLFSSGKSISAFPIKAIFKLTEFESPFPCKVMFVVPKKKHKRANKRNTLKRRMREVYRLNKNSFYANISNQKVELMFIYLSNEEVDYKAIESNINLLLKKVSESVLKIETQTPKC